VRDDLYAIDVRCRGGSVESDDLHAVDAPIYTTAEERHRISV